MKLFVLGRQSGLSLAELVSLFGSSAVQGRPQPDVALVDIKQADIARIGGSLKIAGWARQLDALPHSQLAQELAALLPESDSKINLGISWYPPAGGQADGKTRAVKALALEVKKQAKAKGRSLRVVPNQQPSLSTAQTWHNRLDKPPNVEFMIVESGQQLIIGRVEQVQDIEAYARRDQGRPARDAKVGMLPPKLAQIIINLAGLKTGRILDPFVGTGVVLQEAALMGYSVYGSDIEARMVEYSRRNLLALELKADLETADATAHTWKPPIDSVVSEVYLGPPLTQIPGRDKLAKLAEDSGRLLSRFLTNIKPQLEPGTPLVLAVPAWFSSDEDIVHSTVVDQIEALGYTRRSFKSVSNQELIYRRPSQVVGRELLVLNKQ